MSFADEILNVVVVLGTTPGLGNSVGLVARR